MFIQNLNLRKRIMQNKLMEANAGDGTGGGGDAGEGSEGAEGSESGSEDKEGNENKTFTQEDVDKLINERLNSEQQKWEQKIKDAEAEAEKLAKMNKEEKEKYESEKRIADLEKREREVTAKELKITSMSILAEKNLPKDLVDMLDVSSADACKQSIEKIEKIWNAAHKTFQENVENTVNERLRGGKPPKGGKGSTTNTFNFGFTGVRPNPANK